MITICQFLIFVTYVTYISSRFGILPSISESHYRLNRFRQGYFFTLFCWTLAVTMVLESYESSPIYFFSGVGLAFVGAASEFKWTGANTHIIHYLGALVGIVLPLVALYTHSNMWFPSALFALSAIVILLFKIKNAIFWIEIFAFLFIIIGLFLR